MTLLNRTRTAVGSVLAIATIASLVCAFRVYVLAPYRLKQEAMALPSVPAGLTLAEMGLPPSSGAEFTCPELGKNLDPATLNDRLLALMADLQRAPGDLCAGNNFRKAVLYRELLRGQFAINIRALPPDLSAMAKDPDSIPADNVNSSKTPPEELEPAKLFHDLAGKKTTALPETQLQLGLSYVDLMIRQGGRENKARLSSRSIDALSAALDDRPFMIAALYARGLNYLYWPVIAGKLPLAVHDLKTCIALSNLPELRDHPPLVIAEAYSALGDSFVKLADSAWNQEQRRAFLQAATSWWQKGASRFPEYKAFDVRLKLLPGDLPTYVDSTRGLETYINTDLDLLWRHK